MLDCEEVFGESSLVVLKVMMTYIASSRPLWFLNLNPTHFCPRTGLRKLEFQSTFNNINDYINASSLSTSMLSRLGYDAGVLLVSINV